MAGIKISVLPALPAAQLSDVAPYVQAGVTYKGSNSQLVTLFNSSFLPLGGGMMSGAINMGGFKIVNAGDPTVAQDLATKAYVDSVATGLNIKAGCRVATTAALTATYNNGVLGVGATLTNSGALVALNIDGVVLAINDRVLVKNQVATETNGIYFVTNIGSGAVAWVLTRATDYDTIAEIQPGDLVVISAGTANTQTSWIETATVVTMGVSPILWSQFTVNPAEFLKIANNLSELTPTATTARTNISAAKNGANSDITSMTGLTGVLQAPTAIASSAGANVLAFSYVPSAVNYLTVINSIAGVNNGILATGADTNITFSLVAKGTGAVQVKGTGTNDNPTPGYVGEYFESIIPSPGGAIVHAVVKNLTSISLAAGDWDVWGNLAFLPATASDRANVFSGWLSSTSATTPDPSLYNRIDGPASGSTDFCSFSVPSRRFLLSATTTIYISAVMSITAGAYTLAGGIYARRRR